MRGLSFALTLAVILLTGCARSRELKRMLPDAIAGWRAATEAAYYDGEKGIFDYMNGGAEVYLAYGFCGLAVRKYEREGLPPVEVGVYDMGSPRDAYGIFSFERAAPGVDVGQGSEYERGLLRFWQGRYFYMLGAEGQAPGLEEAVVELGRSLVAGRSDCGRRPELVEMLPAQGLDELSVRYFHGAFGLKHHYFLSHEDVLGLGGRAEVVLASYALGAERPRLVLVAYSSEKSAAAGAESFSRAKHQLVQEKKGIHFRTRGEMLAAVFETQDWRTSRALLDEVLPREGR